MLFFSLLVKDGASQIIRINPEFNRGRIINGREVLMGGNIPTRDYPLTSLPKDLQYSDSKIALVADFSSTKKNQVSVYLINHTNETFSTETTALNLPIVLEAHLGNGHWERAEPYNSYGFRKPTKTLKIQPNHFRVKRARHWQEGATAELRYAFYQNGKAVVVSESFQGRLPIGQINKARHDLMSASLVPEPLRIRYIAEQTEDSEIKEEWFNKLKLLRSFGPCHVDLAETQRWISFVHENAVSTGEQRDLAIQLQLELLKPWPSKYSLSTLRETCFKTLLHTDAESESLRPLCWKVAASFSAEIEASELKKLANTAWQKIRSGSATELEKKQASTFLCQANVIDYNPVAAEDDPMRYLDDENPYIRITAANWMMAKGKQPKSRNNIIRPVLTHYIENSENIDVYELVQILHFDRLFNPFATPNWKLWEIALEKDAKFTIPNLSLMFEIDERKSELRKYSQSTVLPKEIRSQLTTYQKENPEGKESNLAKRLLENKKSRNRNNLFQRNFTEPFIIRNRF